MKLSGAISKTTVDIEVKVKVLSGGLDPRPKNNNNINTCRGNTRLVKSKKFRVVNIKKKKCVLCVNVSVCGPDPHT